MFAYSRRWHSKVAELNQHLLKDLSSSQGFADCKPQKIQEAWHSIN
jgi:hypothetical protein